MNSPVVLLAKYVPDILRMEPRNVGIIVWDNGRVSYRFLGESADKIDPPGIVPAGGRHAYREWIHYWQLQLSRSSIRKNDGSKVDRDSPEFMKVLADKSKPSFMLVECAVLHEELNGSIKKATNEFFNALVQPIRNKVVDKASSRELKIRSTAVFRDAGIASHPNSPLKNSIRRPNNYEILEDSSSRDASNRVFQRAAKYYHTAKHVVTQQKGAWQDFSFDYAFGEITTEAIFQRVLLDNPKIVSSTGWMFQWVQESDGVSLTPEQCGILIDSRLHDTNDNSVVGSRVALSRVAKIIDLSDHRSAVARVSEMAMTV